MSGQAIDDDGDIRQSDGKCRILALDGGGAKGFYTLGVLKEMELMLGRPLHERFDYVYGTSTGAIIATLVALGYSVDRIHALYRQHVPSVMSCRTARGRTAALEKLAKEVFGAHTPDDFRMGIGIVATRWHMEEPMIFKGSREQLHGRKESYLPFHGVPIADAVQASCSAYPFFERKFVTTGRGARIELIDGGYCANNPSLYAIADAVAALGKKHADIRLVSIGVGVYPERKPTLKMRLIKKIPGVMLLQKTLEINTQSMDRLRKILFREIPTVRISETFNSPEMATDLLEDDLEKLDILWQYGGKSFGDHEQQIREFLTVEQSEATH